MTMFKTLKALPLVMLAAMLAGLTGGAAGQDLKIALVHGTSGHPFQVFSKQTQTGFMLGLEYATKGTMAIKGRKIVVINKDTKFKPDVARAVLAEAYGDDNVVLAVGATSSGVTKSLLPVAKEYKKILIVEPAVADSLTGKESSKYIFKTSRNSSMDMQAQAHALRPGKDLVVATLAEDYAFGRDGIKAFKSALGGTGASVVHEEYVPVKTTDYTAAAERMFNALKGKKGRKVIMIYIATPGALGKIAALKPERFGIEISTGGHILPVLPTYKAVPGMEGAVYYYYEIPQNPINAWLVREHKKRYQGQPPDFFTAGGMSAAIAVVKALTLAKSTKTEDLIAAMRGMAWDTPKGPMRFRPEDGQALQDMFHFKIKVDPNVKWAIPSLVRVIKASEMKIPVNK